MGAPDWQVAVIDGKPEMVVNAAALARMACNSPLGIHAAMHALKQNLPPDAFAEVENELRVIADHH